MTGNKRGGWNTIEQHKQQRNRLTRENWSLAPSSRAPETIWSENPNVIQMRNTITKRKRMLALAGSGHFPPPETLHVQPNYNKNKLKKGRRRTRRWGRSAWSILLPGQEWTHSRQRPKSAQNDFPSDSKEDTWPMATFPKACSLVSAKCTWDPQKGIYG